MRRGRISTDVTDSTTFYKPHRSLSHLIFTLISSGAKRAASLTATGATSSTLIAGRFDTILTSGTG